MLYRIAHFIRDKFGFLWRIIEWGNALVFSLKYAVKLRDIHCENIPNGYSLIPIDEIQIEKLVDFFSHQPEEAFTYFHPHGFDTNNLRRLQRNKAFLGYLLVDEESDQIAGYCFLRCYCNGQGYRGRMVDINYRGKGLGTAMNKIMDKIGFGIGLRLYESVSRDNIPSYRSALSASNIKIVKELGKNEVLLEILPD